MDPAFQSLGEVTGFQPLQTYAVPLYRSVCCTTGAVLFPVITNKNARKEERQMTDTTRAAYESALYKLNELSERLAIGRENDDYLHRLANAAQDVAIAAREVYAEA